MVTLKRFETSRTITIGDVSYSISSQDMNNLCIYTGSLIDEEHEGPALVDIGGETLVLSQQEWEGVYEALDNEFSDMVDMAYEMMEAKH